jgi:hypothetical protein
MCTDAGNLQKPNGITLRCTSGRSSFSEMNFLTSNLLQRCVKLDCRGSQLAPATIYRESSAESSEVTKNEAIVTRRRDNIGRDLVPRCPREIASINWMRFFWGGEGWVGARRGGGGNLAAAPHTSGAFSAFISNYKHTCICDRDELEFMLCTL